MHPDTAHFPHTSDQTPEPIGEVGAAANSYLWSSLDRGEWTLCSFLPVSACSTKLSDAKYGNGERAIAEYRDEAQHLQLAPGWQWPSNLDYRDVVDSKEIRYERNLGRVDAAWYWHCSWARTYFIADNEHDKETAFIEVLKIKTTAYFKWGLDDVERKRRDKVLEDAKAGDTATLWGIIDVNCPESTK